MDRIKLYVIARLREPTTWRGIILILTALGVTIPVAHHDLVIAAGLALAGGIAVAAPDRKD